MLDDQAVTSCVHEMNKMDKFASASDDHKTKAAVYVFKQLHEDAILHLPMGASESDVRHYGKAALKRIHSELRDADASEFEQENGFPLLLILELIPTLWALWSQLKKWMEW